MLSQDIDLDGKPDVLVCGFTSNKVSIMRNLSTPGTFSFAPKFDLSFSGATRCIAPADYDGDGWVDLFVSRLSSCLLYHNAGNGTFTLVTNQPPVTTGGAKPRSVSTAMMPDRYSVRSAMAARRSA